MLRVASIYLPNGNPPEGEKYAYKLKWMDRLIHYARERLALEEPLILAGDYNVIASRASTPAIRRPGPATRCSCRRRARSFRRLCNLGLTDPLRAGSDEAGLYTFWDYQAGAWQKNDGIRIDHLLLSPQAADLLVDVQIDRHVRAWEKPSDHVPVVVDLAIEHAMSAWRA